MLPYLSLENLHTVQRPRTADLIVRIRPTFVDPTFALGRANKAKPILISRASTWIETTSFSTETCTHNIPARPEISGFRASSYDSSIRAHPSRPTSPPPRASPASVNPCIRHIGPTSLRNSTHEGRSRVFRPTICRLLSPAFQADPTTFTPLTINNFPMASTQQITRPRSAPTPVTSIQTAKVTPSQQTAICWG